MALHTNIAATPRYIELGRHWVERRNLQSIRYTLNLRLHVVYILTAEL